MHRRELLKSSAAALSLSAFPYHLFAKDQQKLASDVIELGPKKIKLSRLAMGTGTNGGGGSSNQTKQLGVEGLARMLEAAVDNGVNFWDSADQYGTHPYLKAGLARVKRDKVVILSKTHASTEAEMKADIDRFRRELNTDYIDILLLHCMMDGNWPERKKGAMEHIARLQSDGIVRTKGVSCHTMAALKTAAATPWVEVDLARINPAGVAMDAAPEVGAAGAAGDEGGWQGDHRDEDLRRGKAAQSHGRVPAVRPGPERGGLFHHRQRERS